MSRIPLTPNEIIADAKKYSREGHKAIKRKDWDTAKEKFILARNCFMEVVKICNFVATECEAASRLYKV